MTAALGEIAALVYRESGIRLAERQFPFLLASLHRVRAGCTPQAFLSDVSDPLQRRQLVARLIEEVAVKETSFLRDRHQLASIDWRLLLADAQARGTDRVRVWTAPCATGEEAYSLALLACEAFAPAMPPVSILATDISGDALARARVGSYSARSARGLDPARRERYFRVEPEGLVVGEQLRALVTFARHNLVRDPYPPLGEAPFDVILCRNVLIYFDDAAVGQVLRSFERALAASGTLLLGAADALCASASRHAQDRAAAPRAGSGSHRARHGLRRPLGRLAHAAPSDAGQAHRVEAYDLRGCAAVLAETSRLLAEDPLDAAAHFRRGLAQLESDDPAAAVSSLRRALYVEPHFGLAAFKLGGAHEALGDLPAAQRAYERALRALEPDERHEPYLAQIELADVATAIQARLDALATANGAEPQRDDLTLVNSSAGLRRLAEQLTAARTRWSDY